MEANNEITEEVDNYDDDCGYDDRDDQKQLREDTFYALTDGQCGEYHDGIDMDDLMDGLGY